MNPLFMATPSDTNIASALAVWPELAGRTIRPLLVTAFGDIYVEAKTGEVLVVDPLELMCSHAATSVAELEKLFSDQKWAAERLMTNLALLAEERGLRRASHQVFAVAPHPCFTGKLRVEQLIPMDLHIWHHLCSQLRGAEPDGPVPGGSVE
jgi:hypothetical protein